MKNEKLTSELTMLKRITKMIKRFIKSVRDAQARDIVRSNLKAWKKEIDGPVSLFLVTPMDLSSGRE